ncbi:hypothetical protein [Streptomyces sp. NPDC088775]|uniref:hypothetical protein n=1 Tax=Streptomyces sp. NPDC088775 TaxID=3365896 RepID=UPI00382EB2C2
MTALIEDHALVGDMHTAALIHRRGSVTWQSFPDFDSPAALRLAAVEKTAARDDDALGLDSAA